MEKSVADVLIRGIEDELYAAKAFLALTALTDRLDLQQRFIEYSQEESEHALHLLKIYEKISGSTNLQVPVRPLPEITDLYVFLTEYLADEESAIFYYDILIALKHEDMDHALLQKIRDEEKCHFKILTELVETIL